jgi:hypothetical protein
MDNVDMAGFIFVPYDDGQYSVWTTFYRGFDVPGFVGAQGSVVQNNDMSLSFTNGTGMISKLTPMWSKDADPRLLGMSPTYNGSPKMQSLGDMDGAVVTFIANGLGNGISDILDKTTFFASFAASKSNPGSIKGYDLNKLSSMMGMSQTQIMGMLKNMNTDMAGALKGMASIDGAMLGSTDSKTGSSIWVGAQMPALFTEEGKIGLEYNWGSKYWRPFTYGEDTLIGSKAAVRGQAVEAYYTQPISKALSMQLRYTYIDYKYTGSQAFFGDEGAPMTIADAKAAGMNPVDSASDLRFYIRYKY